MSPSSGKMAKNNSHFITAIILLFTFQIQFVLSNLNAVGTDNKEALLQQWGAISGQLPPGKYNGKEVTALAYNYPPMFSYKKLKEGNYTFEGTYKDHMEEIAEYLNISLKYVILDPVNVTRYGLVAATEPYIFNKVVDFIPIATYQSIALLNRAEVLAPTGMDSFILLQHYPEEESHLDVTIKPFELPVWLCLLGTVSIFVLSSSIIIKNKMDIVDSNANHQSLRITIYHQLDYVIRLFTNQGSSGTHSRTRTSFKILTGIWLLSMVVLINGYSGVLTSLLTVPKLKPIAKTLKDVAESKELRVSCENNAFFCLIFLNATEGYEKVLGDQLRNEPTLVVSDGLGALKNVINHKAAYPAVESFVNYMVRDDTKRNGHCRLTTSPPLRAYPTMGLQIKLPLGSPYAAVYSEAVHRMWANGMIIRLRDQFFKSTDQCRIDKPPETKKRPLTLNDLSAAFFILGVGLSLSTFCFIIEIMSKYVFILAQHRNSKASRPITEDAEPKQEIE